MGGGGVHQSPLKGKKKGGKGGKKKIILSIFTQVIRRLRLQVTSQRKGSEPGCPYKLSLM